MATRKRSRHRDVLAAWAGTISCNDVDEFAELVTLHCRAMTAKLTKRAADEREEGDADWESTKFHADAWHMFAAGMETITNSLYDM